MELAPLRPGTGPRAGRRVLALPLPGGDTTAGSYRAIESAAGAAGALVSTAPDLATFITALANGQLLGTGTFNEMTRDIATEEFGLGLFPSGLPSGAGIGNGGAIPRLRRLHGHRPRDR